MPTSTPQTLLSEQSRLSKHLGALTNCHVLCFVLGWHGGTVHQVAKALKVTAGDIVEADYEKMGHLCRQAQAIRAEEEQLGRRVLYKQLRRCIDGLKEYHASHKLPLPEYVTRAEGIAKITAESL